MSENTQDPSDNSHIVALLKPRSRLRRLGCGIGLVIWVILLFLPCLAIVLISQAEIAVQLGDIPGQSLRIWLVQDAAERGIGIARPSVLADEKANTCLQTDTSFILWMGKGESTSYCECYVYDGENWKSVSAAQQSCNP